MWKVRNKQGTLSIRNLTIQNLHALKICPPKLVVEALEVFAVRFSLGASFSGFGIWDDLWKECFMEFICRKQQDGTGHAGVQSRSYRECMYFDPVKYQLSILQNPT